MLYHLRPKIYSFCSGICDIKIEDTKELIPTIKYRGNR